MVARAGALSRDFPSDLSPQFRALSRALQIENDKPRYSAAPQGPGQQVAGAVPNALVQCIPLHFGNISFQYYISEN